jgi:hypothetical protein
MSTMMVIVSKWRTAGMAVALGLLLLGCAGNPPQAVKATDSACVGAVEPPPPGLTEVQDTALLNQALGAPQQGKLCLGKVFKMTAQNAPAVVVYRVWDEARPYTALGSWWSFAPPQGPRDRYRQENEICPAWSALNKLSRCTLKSGAEIVVGPGQSAQCSNDLIYPASPVNQVYIANDARQGRILVENCQDMGAWPVAP